MAGVRDQEALTDLVAKLFEKQIQATIQLSQTEQGMEAEVRILPTENLTTVAYSLAQSELGLVYDGELIRVQGKPENALPEERTVER